MKYIRTKDGVYEEVGFDEECIIPSPLIKVKNNYGEEKITHCCKDDILKQSESLEELCDQIVCGGILYQNKITRNGCYCLVEDNFEELEEPINHGMIREGIYGAIWTDKGLIYVAKMNDKGELVLI